MELWARDFHLLRCELGSEGATALLGVSERWLRECWIRRGAIPFRCAPERSGETLQVAAVRFLDEGGEILVIEVDEFGCYIVEAGDLVRHHWVRPPVQVPVEIMKLALEHGGPDGQS